MRSSSSKYTNGYMGIPELDKFSGRLDNSVMHAYEGINTWNRPSDWLELPRLVQGDQRFCGLLAIYRGASGNSGPTADSNFVAFMCSGNYIVDWGNGVTQSVTGGHTAQYQYNWAGISASTTTSEGFRQVIVQAYPQAGQNLTQVNLQRRYTDLAAGITFTQFHSTGWLDVRVAGPNITAMVLRNSTIGSSVIQHSALHQFEFVGTSQVSGVGYFVRELPNLRRILGEDWTTNFTSYGNMFAYAGKLESVPALKLNKSTTNLSNMFADSAIRTIPLIDTSHATNMSRLFVGCTRLQSVPPLNTSNVTNMDSMFYGCSNLREIPYMDTSKVTSMSQMFRACSALIRLPTLDTSNVTSMSTTFYECSSLVEIPDFNTAKVTDITNCFRGCGNLVRLPNWNMSNVQTANSAFSYVNASIPATYDFSKVQNFGASFNGYQGTFVPAITGTSGTNFTDMFLDSKVRRAVVKGVNASISYQNCFLSSGALNEVFDNLSNTGTGKTVTITNNWGATGCNRGIATAKGWTVAG